MVDLVHSFDFGLGLLVVRNENLLVFLKLGLHFLHDFWSDVTSFPV